MCRNILLGLCWTKCSAECSITNEIFAHILSLLFSRISLWPFFRIFFRRLFWGRRTSVEVRWGGERWTSPFLLLPHCCLFLASSCCLFPYFMIAFTCILLLPFFLISPCCLNTPSYCCLFFRWTSCSFSWTASQSGGAKTRNYFHKVGKVKVVRH